MVKNKCYENLIGGSTEQSGQKIQLSGNQSDRFTIDCDSIKIK